MRHNTFLNTIAMHEELLLGKELQKLQRQSGISILALCRMTGLSRASIYRAFEDKSCKPYKVLIRIALDHPDIFAQSDLRV